MLDSEVLAFDVDAQDDFGIQRVGLEWRSVNDDKTKGDRIAAEQALAAHAARLNDQTARLAADDRIGMITAVHPLHDPALQHDPNIVKAVLDHTGRALYFSRSTIPHPRTLVPDLPFWRHMGIYGYRRPFLHQFVQWPPSPLELSESLEQLRALENGASIKVLPTNDTSPGVDTPEQAREIERLLTTHHSSPL